MCGQTGIFALPGSRDRIGVPPRQRAVLEQDRSLPEHPARHRPFCRKRVEAIGTHHGVLEMPTIDASCDLAQDAGFRTQAIEGFTDEQSTAALTGHRSSFCLRCYSSGAAQAGAAVPAQAAGCSHIGDRARVSFDAPHSTFDWPQVGHRCGPRAFEV